jgi:RNA polymerase sigma-70 factor (ECF subfamily)
MNTDEQLVIEFQQGSRDAFAELFERYRQPVYGFFRRRLQNPGRAEELAQECFLALLRNANRYEPRASFRSYLYGIAFHVLSAERRKAGREAGLEADREAGANEALDTRTAGSARTSTPDAGIWVRDALEHLCANDREILMLREYEQLSYDEVGNLLRLPLNTVRSRLFRARMALKQQLMPVNDRD